MSQDPLKRIAELEAALRTCIRTCLFCNTFATWSTRRTLEHELRLTFCAACKSLHEKDRYAAGSLAGERVYDDWRWMEHDAELARVYAGAGASTVAPPDTTPSLSDVTESDGAHAPTQAAVSEGQ